MSEDRAPYETETKEIRFGNVSIPVSIPVSVPEPASPPILADVGREVVRLTREKRRLVAECAEVGEKLRIACEQTKAIFAAHGIGETRVDGTLIKLQRSLHVGAAGEPADLVKALRDYGLGDLVFEDVRKSGLKGWITEQPEGPDGMPIIPDELRAQVAVVEEFKIVAYPK